MTVPPIGGDTPPDALPKPVARDVTLERRGLMGRHVPLTAPHGAPKPRRTHVRPARTPGARHGAPAAHRAGAAWPAGQPTRGANVMV
ncbi:hypothetical protein LAJ19_10255 [Deinococcus taeanensis]|uniref:hypothetical protein n=1 Tax=Deinococcus taeanensis TaxID=2737050 RepID=UPI001CDD1F0D|nr:hypothetical protein [Deinococcus taeanensis]UBV42017.1 hypothetical protein LAJ19_10255 [Deinococcus taeanensis]